MRFDRTPPKQLLVVAGETLQARQIRQLAVHGIEPITVTNNAQLTAVSPRPFSPQGTSTILHTLRSSRALWAERTIILLGDVFYSPGLMADMVNYAGAIRFWLNGAEIFAMSFAASAAQRVLDAIDRCITATTAEWNGRTLHGDLRLWHLLRELSGLDIHRHVTILNDMTQPEVTDYTRDFDSAAAHQDFIRELPNFNVS